MTDLSLAHHIGAILARAGEGRDPAETAEWCEALDALTAATARRAPASCSTPLLAHARRRGVHWQPSLITPYVNTIALENQAALPPATLAMEQRLAALMRWNALAMVNARQPRRERWLGRARRPHRELRVGGGPVRGRLQSFLSRPQRRPGMTPRRGTVGGTTTSATWCSSSALGRPAVYARAFLEGRLSADDLAHYRQELVAPAHGARGLTSYPHPQLDARLLAVPDRLDGDRPDQRDLPGALPALPAAPRPARTGSGAGQRRVWGFFGDGEMDEPESIAALSLAAREQLDNCTFVINCNLQRLDGRCAATAASSTSSSRCSPVRAGT
jgi:pyruvate dehydrogenase E1 component